MKDGIREMGKKRDGGNTKSIRQPNLKKAVIDITGTYLITNSIFSKIGLFFNLFCLPLMR
jgi:hypothetical protein